jgi:hypothetical protein
MLVVGPEFEVDDEVAKEVDTLGGYIATRIGRVPVRGELVPGPGRLEIEVLDADPRRVKRLKIFVSHDIANLNRDPQRRVMAAGHAPQASNAPQASSAPPASNAPPASSTPPAQSELPINRDPSVKLSPDDPPSKAPRKS